MCTRFELMGEVRSAMSQVSQLTAIWPLVGRVVIFFFNGSFASRLYSQAKRNNNSGTVFIKVVCTTYS